MLRRLMLFFAVCLLAGSSGAAEPSGREKQVLEGINAAIRQAGLSYRDGDYEASAESIRRAMRQAGSAMKVASPAMHDAMRPTIERIAKAHAMLELEGVSMPPFRRPPPPDPGSPATDAAGDKESAPPGGKPMPAGGGDLRFTSDVAPILVSRCGQCHVRNARGGFSMKSYAALMRGPRAGRVVFPGDVTASRLIETIETGDMPRGGGRVPPKELETLKAWVLAGAEFDGDDPTAPLAAMASSAGEPAGSRAVEVRAPSGDETVSFKADVAPLLVENCRGCHIGARQGRGGLRMDTFAQLLRGGDSGEIIRPGDGSGSLLVQKLKGDVGMRMPAGGRPPLSEQQIALVSTWIDEGAAFDGASESQPLVVMSQIAWVESATVEEISERRRGLAEQHLELAVSGASLAQSVTDHFFVIGTAAQTTIDLVAQQAESEMKVVRGAVPGNRGEAYFDGRATIFVLPRRYDYSEFAKMVERRDVPDEWTAHWHYDRIDAYVAMLAGDGDDDDLFAQRLIAPLTALAVATRGSDVPRWFAEGVGATMAQRHGSSRDRREIRRRESETVAAINAMKDAQAFLDGKLTPEQSDKVGAAVVSSLLDRTRRRYFDRLIRQLGQGRSFEQAFSRALQMTSVQYIDRWLARARGSR